MYHYHITFTVTIIQGWYMSHKSAFCAADAFEAEAMAVRGRKIRTRRRAL